MEITVEFKSVREQHLKALEQQLKHVHDVHTDLVIPRDPAAPALVAIGITRGGQRGEHAVLGIAQVLYNFLHSDPEARNQNKVFLVTIEGERMDVEPLSIEEIKGIIVEALAGE